MANNLETVQAPRFVERFFMFLEGRGRFGIALFSFLLGVLLSTSFAPQNFFPALFIAFPCFILLVDRAQTGSEAFGRGWWAGFGLFAIGLNWIGYSFTQQDHVPAFLGPFAVFGLSALLSIYIGLTFWVSWRLKAKGIGRVILFAASWTFFEAMRGMLFTGFPWHLVGSAWADWLPVAQSVHYISVYGLSFITILSAGIIALLVMDRRIKRSLSIVIPCLFIIPVLAFVGSDRLKKHETRYHLGVSLRLVQANVTQREKWRSYLINDHFDNHMQLSRGKDADGKVKNIKLLIWPETAVQRETFDREGSVLRWRMSRLLEFGNYAITGVPRYERIGDRIHYYNSLMAVNSKAEIYAKYDKTHLVPFGEYVPFEDIFKMFGLGQLTGGVPFTAGTELQTIHLPGVPSFSPLICYEAIFPGQVTRADDRPNWMLNISNDAWFGVTNGPHQHLALARLRAIEEGMPIVRSTSTGISAVVDSYGRVISSLKKGRGIIDAPLPAALKAPAVPTGFRVLVAVVLCIFIILGFLVFSIWADKRR